MFFDDFPQEIDFYQNLDVYTAPSSVVAAGSGYIGTNQPLTDKDANFSAQNLRLDEILPVDELSGILDFTNSVVHQASPTLDVPVDVPGYEFGAFGLGAQDRELDHSDNYSLMEINRDEDSFIVGSIHFPSSQPVEFQIKILEPLLNNIYDRIDLNDNFVVIGDINCLTVVGQDASDAQKLEVESNISKIVAYLEAVGAEKGIQFQVDFPLNSIAKERVADDLTMNPQELIKSGVTIRDTMISITGKYIGLGNITEEAVLVSYTSSALGQTNDIVDFKLLGEHPFDHVIISAEVNGLKIYYVNVIESAGDKGFKENQYKELPDAQLSLQWTRDVYETLAIILKPNLSADALNELSNIELKDFLNSSKIEFNGGVKSDKEEIVQLIADDFISQVKLLPSTNALIDLLKEDVSINWAKITSEIVRSCVGKDGAISSFTTKLAASNFSQEVFGGFVLSEQYHVLHNELGAAGVRDLVEQHQLDILIDLQKQENSLVLLCENNKEASEFTAIAKSLVIPLDIQEHRIFH